MVDIRINEERNGIELRFDSKPDQSVMDSLKANGFRWSKYQKMWYAKQTESRMDFANSLNSDSVDSGNPKLIWNKADYDLWDMTRIKDIENHYAIEKLHDNKEIAKRIRTHLRKRFPMCKWSVTSDYSSIDVKLKSAPWDRESDEVKAITEYAFRYTDSYNYDNSDSMSDYFDVNFYGTCSAYSVIGWDYEIKEETVNERRISESFKMKKKEYDVAERVREEHAFKLRQIEIEKEHQAYLEREKIRKANHELVEQNIEIKDVEEYFILNLMECSSKLDSEKEYIERIKDDSADSNKKYIRHAKISRELHMSNDIYDLFSNLLMDDWSFLECMGGSETMDNRVNSVYDYYQMSKEERDTVEYYSCRSIAIYVDGELKTVIDPQGYNYARYCFFPTENTVIHGHYVYDQIVSDKEKADNRHIASEIEDASASIIVEHNLMHVWNEDGKYHMYLLGQYMKNNNINLTVGVVREIEIPELKKQMYKYLGIINSLRSQFINCELEKGDKFTLFRIDPWLGGLTVLHGIYESHEPGTYAQHEDAVKLIYKPEGKRKLQSVWLYGDMLVYRDWLDLPDNVLWEVNEGSMFITKKSKYMSCDREQYKATMEYLTNIGHKPIVNTYK